MVSNKKRGVSSTAPPRTIPTSPTPGAFSLRLPPPLRAAADRYADATGVSLNGLVCIAMADYLASRGHQAKK